VKAILIFVALAVIAFGSLLFLGNHTTLSISPAVQTIGISTPVTVVLTNPHGVRAVNAYLEQDGQQYPVFEQHQPATRLWWRKNVAPHTMTFEAGKSKATALKEGKARLVVEAVSNDMRGSTDSVSNDVNVVLSAPRVIPDDAQHYINQGGMEMLTMTTSGSWNNAGVRVANYTFRSFPLPGKSANQRFAWFAYPWDLAPDVTPVAFASNAAGTTATANFWFRVFPKKFRVRDFEIDDKLMQKLVNSVDPTGQLAPGPDLLTRFLKINGEMRRKNNQQLADLRFKTEDKVLWHGPFLHWARRRRISLMSATTSITARRSTSRYILALISRTWPTAR